MADPSEVEQDDEDQAPPRKNWRKELEGQRDVAEAKAADLERRLAFVEAGLTGLSDKQVKALLSAHEGEITATAIKATADELGFAAKARTAEAEVDPEQAAREREVSELSRFAGGAQPEGSAVMSQDEVIAKINSFDSPEALKEWALANPDLFTSGAPS